MAFGLGVVYISKIEEENVPLVCIFLVFDFHITLISCNAIIEIFIFKIFKILNSNVRISWWLVN